MTLSLETRARPARTYDHGLQPFGRAAGRPILSLPESADTVARAAIGTLSLAPPASASVSAPAGALAFFFDGTGA